MDDGRDAADVVQVHLEHRLVRRLLSRFLSQGFQSKLSRISVRGAPISRDADWLPAIEQFGEGIFIHFGDAAVSKWLHEDSTAPRNKRLLAGYAHWQKRFVGKAPSYPGTPYVLLHSISHALMAEIALDCGYPASSLKERVYALSGSRIGGEIDRCGILIYTASAGAQGTLGGLVATAPRFANILRSALDRLRICSKRPDLRGSRTR